VATLGRVLFVVSVAFFVVGVLVTVFGFNDGTGLADADTRSRQLPLQVRPSRAARTQPTDRAGPGKRRHSLPDFNKRA